MKNLVKSSAKWFFCFFFGFTFLTILTFRLLIKRTNSRVFDITHEHTPPFCIPFKLFHSQFSITFNLKSIKRSEWKVSLLSSTQKFFVHFLLNNSLYNYSYLQMKLKTERSEKSCWDFFLHPSFISPVITTVCKTFHVNTSATSVKVSLWKNVANF